MGYRILYLRTVRVRVQLYTTTKVQYTYSRTRMQHYFVGIKYMYVYIHLYSCIYTHCRSSSIKFYFPCLFIIKNVVPP